MRTKPVLNNAIYDLNGTLAEARDTAERIFADAHSIAEDPALARERALVFAAMSSLWEDLDDAQRRRIVEIYTEDTIACARAIVADGRAWYYTEPEGGRRMLVGAFLAQAEASPIGYIPIMTTDAEAEMP